MKTYPINLVLQDKLVILVGAGEEISRKIPGLLEVGARVRIIAPTIHNNAKQHIDEGKVEWLARPYQGGDLAGAALVIAATNDQDVHNAVWAEGSSNGQLVNVMDVMPQCNFHAVSTVRRGQLTIAIGTGGAAPALAVTLRRRFEAEFGPEYAEFLAHVQNLRPLVAARIPPFRQRAEFWYALVDSDALELLRQGNPEQFEERVEQLLQQYEAEV